MKVHYHVCAPKSKSDLLGFEQRSVWLQRNVRVFPGFTSCLMVCRGKPGPLCSVLFCGLAGTHCHEWRMTLVWGFVFVMVGKTWLGKCVAQIMSPISRGAICGVCHSQTSPGARGQSCTQSLNNKVVVMFPWVSVWSFPELLSEVSSLPSVSATFCSFSVRNPVREQHQAAWQVAGNGQEAFLKFLPSLKGKTGPSDSLWQGSWNWPLWWRVEGVVGASCWQRKCLTVLTVNLMLLWKIPYVIVVFFILSKDWRKGTNIRYWPSCKV